MGTDDAAPSTPGSVGSRDPNSGEIVTTAHVFAGEGARALGTGYDFEESMPLRCGRCGREGPASSGAREYYNELFDISCPQCDRMLLIVPYPTDQETKEATGNREALRNLARVEERERRWARAERLQLKPTSDLPDLPGERLRFIWDFEESDDEVWTLIKRGDQAVWRELAFWEGRQRFNEVKAILKERYGARFARLQPTEPSKSSLYGDAWTTAHIEET